MEQLCEFHTWVPLLPVLCNISVFTTESSVWQKDTSYVQLYASRKGVQNSSKIYIIMTIPQIVQHHGRMWLLKRFHLSSFANLQWHFLLVASVGTELADCHIFPCPPVRLAALISFSSELPRADYIRTLECYTIFISLCG